MRRVALKRICALVTDPGPDEERRAVALEHIVGGTGEIDAGAELPRRRPAAGLAAVEPGDVLFGKLRPYLAKTLQIREPMFASTELLALRSAPGVDSRWLHYLVMSDRIVRWAVAGSEGSKMPRTSWSALGGCRVAVPEPRPQRAIADFLDAETARIDALIEKKCRMIELLDERFWNWLSDRIRQTAAPIAPLRRALAWITDGPFGSSLTSAHYSDEGARVVRLGNIGMADFKNEDEAYISEEHYASLLKHRVRAGDLLIAGLGDSRNHVGRGCVAPDLGPALVKADCYCAAVEEGIASAEFLALYLASPLGRNAVAYLSRGSTRTRINLDVAKAIPVILPPQSEQAILVAEARQRRQTNSSVQESLSRQIRLLQEHRQALITAAVTGQLTIPGLAA